MQISFIVYRSQKLEHHQSAPVPGPRECEGPFRESASGYFVKLAGKTDWGAKKSTQKPNLAYLAQ